MARVACVMMQRDEDDLLAPWLAYHGYLFGFENLYVYDNGSSNSLTREVIRCFQKVGVNFDFSHTTGQDFENKGEIFRNRINQLNAAGRYDIFFPIDCDEFVVVLGERGLSCARSDIDDNLTPAVGWRGVMVIPTLLYNVPGRPEAFYFQDQQKVFFATGEIGHLEMGFHSGGMPGAEQPRKTPITYLHFHNRSFPTLLQRALMKLKERVDIDDMSKVLDYRGHGDHLVRYFRMTERDYVSSFAGKDVVLLPGFLELLAALGSDSAVRRASFADLTGIDYTGEALPAEFDGAAYWQANPDVAARQTPALFHYYRHGRRERRRLRLDAASGT